MGRLIIGYDFGDGDIPVLMVIRKNANEEATILKVFTGKEATDEYDRLTKSEEEYNHDNK